MVNKTITRKKGRRIFFVSRTVKATKRIRKKSIKKRNLRGYWEKDKKGIFFHKKYEAPFVKNTERKKNDKKIVGRKSFFLWIIIPIFAFWLLNPKSDVIGKEAKLNQPRFKKAKTIFNIGFRSVLLLCIAIMLWTYMLPFLYGTYTVFKGGELMRIKGTVSCVTVPFPLLDVFTQEIVLKENDKKNSYRFWYPLRLNLPENRTYELLVLPKSNLVLEARELPGEK